MQTTAGLYPFWFWNSRLTEEEICRQIGEMAAQGVNGFFIHPRQGLAQPYMSDGFFAMVDAAIEEAEKRGLEVNLYDEYPYPSGIAGGEVVIGRPAHAATRLELINEKIPGGRVRRALSPGRVWSCFLYPDTGDGVDWKNGKDVRGSVGFHLSVESYHDVGLTAYNRKRYFADVPTPVLEMEIPEGDYRLVAAVQVEVEDFKYWGRYVDVLNPDAIGAFIEATHERYRRRYGERFGKGIASIFADETQAGWSERLPAAFLEEYGRDLDFSALASTGHPEHLRTMTDLERLKYRLFLETFEKPIRDWCRRHGIAYSGEKPCARFSQFAYMDVPGIDGGHAKTGGDLELLHPNLRNNARAVASAAWFYGKRECLCECYHSLGWSATLNDARWIADGLMLMGITKLVPHGFFYSTHGLKKHDAPPSFFFQMPYWRHFGKLSERVERIGEAFAGTRIDARILIVDPNSGLPTRDDLGFYRKIMECLSSRHLDFHIVDTDILEAGRIENGKVCVREIEADWVIVPPMRVVEEPLAAWLRQLEGRGGNVLRWNADTDVACRESLFKAVAPALRIECNGRPADSVYAVTRVGNGKRLWFLLNLSGKRLEVTLDAGVPLREVPLADDELKLLKPSPEGGGWRRVIEPFEGLLVSASDQVTPSTVAPRSIGPSSDDSTSPDDSIRIQIPSEATVRRLTPNLVRLGFWQMSLLDANGEPEFSATVPAVPLANQLEQGGFPFRPGFRSAFGMAPKLEFPRLRVRYETAFRLECDAAVQLVVEPESLEGEWRLLVNDRTPITADDLKPVEVHVHGSFGLDLTPFLRSGENTLRVELTTDRGDAGLRNPLYLAGDFFVATDPLRLLAPREEGVFEDYEGNGLPFFAGSLEYVSTVLLNAISDTENLLVNLDYPDTFDEAAEVSFNGGPFYASPWPPRRLLVPARYLKTGANKVVTRVHTSLCRSFEGQWFDHVDHRYRASGERV